MEPLPHVKYEAQEAPCYAPAPRYIPVPQIPFNQAPAFSATNVQAVPPSAFYPGLEKRLTKFLINLRPENRKILDEETGLD